MALKLDNTLLEELGLAALPDAEKQLLLRQIYEKLEMNVGMRLADQMSNEQLDAFEKFVDANDDKGAFQWLETNFPNYKAVVNEEFEKLKAEIRSVAPQILASAQQNAANGVGAGQQQPGQPQGGQQAGPQQGGPGGPQAGGQQYAQPPQGQPGGPQQGPTPPPYPPQPQYPGPQSQPYPPQQQYPSPGAVPQGGHLQPQYGVPPQGQPAPQQPQPGQRHQQIYPDPSQYQQPQYPGQQGVPQQGQPGPQPQYPPQQPPAGPNQQ